MHIQSFFKKTRWVGFTSVLISILFSAVLTYAQGSSADRKLIVGTKSAPPFSMKSDEGAWEGISISLWRLVAEELNLQYEFRETDLAGLLEGVRRGQFDLAVAALTINSEREKIMDFSHSFFTTGLGIAVRSKPHSPWIAVAQNFFDMRFLKIIVTLVTVLLAAGFLIWFFERRKNPEQFSPHPHKGIGSGFWWSVVTMTTVGYGDKTPRSLWGRLIAIIWMFTSIIIISIFTAAITSSLTVSKLESSIKGLDDLSRARIGTITATTSETYLRKRFFSFKRYNSADKGLVALADGKIDALVYDKPLLRYFVNKNYQGLIQILPVSFYRQDYGIAFQEGSGLREPVNRVLLKKIVDPVWEGITYRYLGR
jgi:ABC-type amino acid transport substrate-binding protein